MADVLLCAKASSLSTFPGFPRSLSLSAKHLPTVSFRKEFGKVIVRRDGITSASLDLDCASRPDVKSSILTAIKEGVCLSDSDLRHSIPQLTSRTVGKVRDTYEHEDGQRLVLVTTDRQSAFDRVLAEIPFKGQVLNQTSAWWFQQIAHLTPSAFLSEPDPNVTVASKCTVFPVEFVVRGYITGSTSTSLWTIYDKGIRDYCGNVFPDGLHRNQQLEKNVLTPTTKSAEHDMPVSPQQIVDFALMTKSEFEEVSQRALEVFTFGQEVAARHGLILVDTKYEFGRDPSGNIVILDEVHTPDSSRYWVAESYEARYEQGLEPQNIDKEFLRLWYKNNCDPYNDAVLPQAPEDLVAELSWRYILLYETITGCHFDIPSLEESIVQRIERNLKATLQ